MKAHYTLDRFEDGNWAVLERDDGVTFNVPSWWLPDEAQEGHVISLSAQPGAKALELTFAIDEAVTKERLSGAREQRERLPRGPEGDLDL